MTQQQHGELERVNTMNGAVFMAMAGDGLETARRRIAGFIRGELDNLNVSHFAWCGLIALHTARRDGLVTSDGC